MLKKALVLLLAVAMVLSSFVACTSSTSTDEPTPAAETPSSEEPAEGDEPEEQEATEEPKPDVAQEVTYNMGDDPETLDPGKASENVGFNILINTFEGLTNLDENDKAIPGVAEKWDVSEDATEFTFYLREDAKWSDGKSVTAHDFVYAWRRAVTPEIAADYAYQLFYLKNAEAIVTGEMAPEDLGVEAIDDKTLKVTLAGSVSWMLEMFAFPTYFPVRQDVVEANPDTWALNAETIVSNGPFKVTAWSHNEEVIMVPNENYWDRDRVKLDKYRITLINENSTALSAFEAGEIDGTDGVPAEEIPRLLAEEPDFMILPSLGVYYFAFNNEVAPVDDEKVRKALSLAIDRNAIVTTVTLGGQAPATGVVPTGINTGGEDFREAGGNYDIDPMGAKVEEAQALLAEAGYPNGEGFPTLTLSYNTNENHKKIAETIQEMWKKNLNIELELTNTEWKVHLANLEEDKFQIGRVSWSADYAHPMTFLDMWLTDSGNNYTNWGDPRFDDLIREAKTTLDINKSLELMHEAEDIFMSRHTILPIYYRTDPELLKGHVKNWRKSPLGLLYMDRAYVEK